MSDRIDPPGDNFEQGPWPQVSDPSRLVHHGWPWCVNAVGHPDPDGGYPDPERHVPWHQCRSAETFVDAACRDLDGDPVGVSVSNAASYRFGQPRDDTPPASPRVVLETWTNDEGAVASGEFDGRREQSGIYIDPARAKVTVGEWAERWLAGQAHLKPSTRERYEGIVRAHILPRWRSTNLADVKHSAVQTWVTDLSRASRPATVRKVHRVLSLILSLAVKDGRLVRNPASEINLPRATTAEQRYLTHEQVHSLARAAAAPDGVSKHRRLAERHSDQYRLIVLFLAYTGVRFGEMAALRVRRIDFLRRRAVIAESVTLVGAQQVWGTPKGHERREVPLPGFLVEELATHVRGKAPDDLVFTGVRGGGALRAPIFRRAAFDRAAAAIGIPGLHPHELRHTAASLAIAEGADVKLVQKMLGHKSATMTLDQYGHLFDDRLNDVADRLDAAARAADVYPMCTEAEIVDLDEKRRSPAGP